MSVVDLGKSISNIKTRNVANDIWETPQPVVDKMIDMCDIQPYDVVLDSCCGVDKIFYNSFPKECIAEYNEILLGKDFFDNHNIGKYDVILGNPPFSLYKRWLEHTILLSPKKFSYVFGVLNITYPRIKYMQDNGYYITKMKMIKVKGWFSGTAFVILFEKGCKDKSIIGLI